MHMPVRASAVRHANMIPHWVEEPFHDPDEQSSWWLINFYLQVPFYVPYLNDATFNVSLPRASYVNCPDELRGSAPFVLMKVIQRRTAAADPSVTPTMLRLLAELRAQGRLAPSVSINPPSAPQPQSFLNFNSIVEAITPKLLLQSELDRGLSLHPGVLLDRCLSAFNHWMNSFTLVTADTQVRPIAKEHLPPTILLFHQSPHTHQLVRWDVLQLHSNIHWSSNTVINPQTADVVAMMASNVEDHHTIWSSAQWLSAAERLAGVDGQYEMAVVALHTAAELLLYGVAALALVDEGKAAHEVDRLFQRGNSLTDVCYNMLQPRLGGDWDRKSRSGAFGRYWQDIVLRRNEVAHRGARVNAEGMMAALQAMRPMVEFVVRRVANRRNSYPRTMMDLVNVFGVPDDVVVGKAFDAKAQTIVSSSPRYWLASDDRRLKDQPSVLAQTTAGTMPTTVSDEKVEAWKTSARRQPFHLVLRAGPSSTEGVIDVGDDDERRRTGLALALRLERDGNVGAAIAHLWNIAFRESGPVAALASKFQ